ncbi:MAG: cation:proton antiporter [Candidatus Zixiibacteriota bacterium]|nr:MAG: cation:proton antiporter [candidate division Zixibacteria bacterium]
MSEHLLVGLASIIVLGILAQWLAWRLHLPAILLLLVFGIIAGPVTGLLEPDAVFGEALFPLVSISVAIILFEGGLSLKLSELRRGGAVIRNLVTVGILVTWLLTALAAYAIVGLQLSTALLVGALLVVSGPTVIIPLLRQVRPKGDIGSIIKWEGIVNDPIGAILAVLVFEVIITGTEGGTGMVIGGVLKAFAAGTIIGVAGAGAMVVLLRRFLVPDFLQNPVSLMLVMLVYVASNMLQTESGLLAVTVMGIVLTNQKFISIRHILEFKENLRVLLIASLFILLAARLDAFQVLLASPLNWIFVILLIAVIRPAAVFASALGTKLRTSERYFLSWMAPRGIVAAAVVSVFAIRLSEIGHPDADKLAPLVFLVIIVTVAVYGLTASRVAQSLKVSQPDPQGVLFAGAHSWSRQMAAILKDSGYTVALVDSNWENVTEARRLGLTAYYGSVLSEEMMFSLQLDGIGRLLAMTPNDEVNSLAALHFVDIFGSSEVYQLPPLGAGKDAAQEEMPKHLRGRFLFSGEANYQHLTTRFRQGAILKKNSMTEAFDYDAFKSKYGPQAVPLFLIPEPGRLRVCTAVDRISPKPGQAIISIVNPVD